MAADTGITLRISHCRLPILDGPYRRQSFHPFHQANLSGISGESPMAIPHFPSQSGDSPYSAIDHKRGFTMAGKSLQNSAESRKNNERGRNGHSMWQRGSSSHTANAAAGSRAERRHKTQSTSSHKTGGPSRSLTTIDHDEIRIHDGGFGNYRLKIR